MRKVLSFVLVLSLVLGSFSMAFAASNAPDDVVGTPYEDSVSVLLDLGVATGFPDGTYRPDEIVNRAQMAVFVVNALGMADFVSTATSSFSDMDGYGWAEGYIGYAQGLGVVTGYGDGTFRPGQTVSYDEAATMLVAALGYTPESLTGSWPANYVARAKALGILDDITAGAEGANRGDIAIMIYQTLDCGIGTVDKDGNWSLNATYKKDNKTGTTEMEWYDTMLERLGAAVTNNGDAFVVTDTIARDKSMINLYPFIGAYIKAYENKDGDIIAVTEQKSTFLTGEINSSDKFKAAGVEYTIKNADFSYLGDTDDADEAYIFINGTLDDTYPMKDYEDVDDLIDRFTKVNKVTIAVDLSGKTIKEVYSVSVWDIEDGAHGLFEAADAREIENDQELYGIAFPEDDYGDIDTKAFALMGAESLSDIKNGDVVYVYYNGDDEVARIEVGTETVTGTVSRISGDDYTVGGTVYNFAAVTDGDSETPSTGDEVTFYLDYNGDVYNCELESGSANTYGIVLGYDSATGAGNNLDDQRVRLFLADGSNKTFYVDEDADFDVSDLHYGDIVKYGVNKSGDIDALVQTTGLYVQNPAQKDVSSRGYYDGYEINSNATIFTISDFDGATAYTGASNYGTTSLSGLKGKENVAAIYAVDKGKIAAMLIDSNATSDDDIYGVVTKIYETDTDAKYGADFLIGKTKTTYDEVRTAPYLLFDAANGFDALYELKFNSSDELSSAVAVGAAITVSSGTDVEDLFSVSNRVMTVADRSKVTDNAGILRVSDSTNANSSATFTLDSDVVYYIWNTKDKAYEVGKESDVTRAKGTSLTIKFICSDDDVNVVDFVLIR